MIDIQSMNAAIPSCFKIIETESDLSCIRLQLLLTMNTSKALREYTIAQKILHDLFGVREVVIDIESWEKLTHRDDDSSIIDSNNN